MNDEVEKVERTKLHNGTPYLFIIITIKLVFKIVLIIVSVHFNL